MNIVLVIAREFDNGQDEVVGLVERIKDFVFCHSVLDFSHVVDSLMEFLMKFVPGNHLLFSLHVCSCAYIFF